MNIGEEEGIPFYNGDQIFLDDLNQFISGPVCHSGRLHDTLIPAKLMFAVYGRKSMQKARAVENFCHESNNFQAFRSVKVEYGRTTLAVDAIQTYLQEVQHIPHMKKVLVIDGADELVLRPDNDLTRQFMLDLQDEIYRQGMIVFACFDKDPIRAAGQNVSEVVRDMRLKIMSYFGVFFFVPQPSSSYRRTCLETLLNDGAKHLLLHGKKVDIQLSDADFANLDTYTSGAGPVDIWRFCQSVLYDAAFDGSEKNPHKGKDTVTITLDVLRTYMTERAGRGLHILGFDPRYEENDLMVACDKGSLLVEKEVPEQKRKNQAAPQLTKTTSKSKTGLKRGMASLVEEDQKRIKLEEAFKLKEEDE